MQKSLIELAFEFVSSNQGAVTFQDLWAYVEKESGLSKEEAMKKVGQFYTNLMLDGRFVTLGDNTWDLRSRHTFDKVHIDMRDVYGDDDDTDNDREEVDEEEKEYNEAFEENNDEDSEEKDSDSESSEEDE